MVMEKLPCLDLRALCSCSTGARMGVLDYTPYLKLLPGNAATAAEIDRLPQSVSTPKTSRTDEVGDETVGKRISYSRSWWRILAQRRIDGKKLIGCLYRSRRSGCASKSDTRLTAKLWNDFTHEKFDGINELTKLQTVKERIADELLIHAQMDVMQIVRDKFPAPNETDMEMS